MAFSISTKSLTKGPRSHSAMHTAISRDHDRKKYLAKQEFKFEKDYQTLERRMISRAKWHQHAENNNLRSNHPLIDRTTIGLEDYIQREKIKQENMSNAKRMGNESIRRASMNTRTKD